MSTLRRYLAGYAAVMVMLALGAAASERYFKTYSLARPPNEETLAAMRMVVGEQGNVLYDRGGLRLFVNADSGAHSNLTAFLRDVDRPGRNVRIDVSMRETARSRSSGVNLGGSGGVTVSGGSITPSGTLTLGAHQRSSRSDGLVQQTLVTLEGSAASLTVGEDVPFYEEWLVQWGYHYGTWERQVTVQRVGAFLTIEPLVSADGRLVTVRLVPTVSALVDGAPQRIQLKQVATEITVANGATIDLGGLTEHRDFYDRFLVGVDRGGQTRSLEIKMTPTVLPAVTAE